LEELDVDGRIIFKFMLRKQDGMCALCSSVSGQEPSTGLCQDYKEVLGCRKCRRCFGELNYCFVLRGAMLLALS
jgi:hypothetical protein